jgi:hypothetical protein
LFHNKKQGIDLFALVSDDKTLMFIIGASVLLLLERKIEHFPT